MRVQVIGLGTVGIAQAFLLTKLGHKVHGYDPQVKNSPSSDRLFLISFIQSWVALVIAIFRLIARRGSLHIYTIPSTRK